MVTAVFTEGQIRLDVELGQTLLSCTSWTKHNGSDHSFPRVLQDTGNQPNNKCLPKFVQADNAPFRVKKINISAFFIPANMPVNELKQI